MGLLMKYRAAVIIFLILLNISITICVDLPLASSTTNQHSLQTVNNTVRYVILCFLVSESGQTGKSRGENQAETSEEDGERWQSN